MYYIFPDSFASDKETIFEEAGEINGSVTHLGWTLKGGQKIYHTLKI